MLEIHFSSNTSCKRQSHNNRQKGISLLEAVVAICVIGIILAAAVPALGSWNAQQRMRSLHSGLHRQINLARYHAMVQQKRVTLCPLSVSGSCKKDWSESISVFIDTNGNRHLDSDEELLNTMSVPQSIKLHWRGMSPNNSMHFTPLGITLLSNGTMSLCSLRPDTRNMSLTLNPQGRATHFSRPANCPPN
ncbi:GspH/FimT family pseudopilin [Pseudomonas sp. TTU2014-080ASC]|uniref:GspH/FimT family pseudopilin n=1 Tax=Pseudomonas sp. TTU2014-080ASC TaxID=1729724 RepID=UPI0009E740C4|nr:GspH/FimT family protein [Pseudomonas sp. TTU2014-080ASC]